MRHDGDKDESHAMAVGAAALVATAVGGVLVLVSPGVLLVFAVCQATGWRTDPGQAWCFSGLASAAGFLGLRVALGEWAAARSAWFVACALAVVATATCAFGFHAAWPTRLLHTLLG